MEILSVKNIRKHYGRHKILQDINLSIKAGSCIVIAGANGCGKSTFLSILAGAARASSGDIYINNEKVISGSRIFYKTIGYVPQENSLFPNLSVKDNLQFWYCDSHRNLKEDCVSGIPAQFGLTKYLNYNVEKLSGGMKKRLSIACSLARDPKVLILDEPSAALDIVCKNDIRKYLLEYKKNGGTIILTSHEDSDLMLADKMYLIENGSLVQLDNPLFGQALADRLVSNGGFHD